MRLRARTDKNQEEIASALEKAGCQVERKLARLGDGIPDLLVTRNGKVYLLEVKRPGEQLTTKEYNWHQKFWCAHIVHSIEEALKVVYASAVKNVL
jgi:hypothetical protein